MTLLERIQILREEHGNISINKLEKEAGLSRGSMSKWDDHAPSHDKLKKVADYFGVSLLYLLGESEQKEKDPVISDEASEQRKRLMEQLSSLSPDQLDQALSYIEFLASNSKK